MPSVLAEVSFISNPVEEKLLSKEDYRDYIAKAMADGVNTYAAAMPDQCKKLQGLRNPPGRKDNLCPLNSKIILYIAFFYYYPLF